RDDVCDVGLTAITELDRENIAAQDNGDSMIRIAMPTVSLRPARATAVERWSFRGDEAGARSSAIIALAPRLVPSIGRSSPKVSEVPEEGIEPSRGVNPTGF